MPQATFVLKEPKSQEPTLIFLFYNFNGQRLKYSTGQKVDPKYWNPEKPLVKETKVFKEYANFNFLLHSGASIQPLRCRWSPTNGSFMLVEYL